MFTAFLDSFEQSFFGLEFSYDDLPVGFDRYAPADQAAIRARMELIHAHAAAGADLEAEKDAPNPPYSCERLPL